MQCAKLIRHDCTRQRLEGFCLDRRLVNWALAATPPHDPLQISGQSASLPKMPAQRRAIPVPGSLSRNRGPAGVCTRCLNRRATNAGCETKPGRVGRQPSAAEPLAPSPNDISPRCDAMPDLN